MIRVLVSLIVSAQEKLLVLGQVRRVMVAQIIVSTPDVNLYPRAHVMP